MATVGDLPDAPDGRAARPRVQSAARAVGILLAIARSEQGLTTREISERLGIGRQATYHLLHTLTASGMVTRDDRGRHLLGLRVGTLAEGFARQLAPAERLTPLLRDLAQKTGEMAYAAGWWNGEITSLAFARGTNPVQAAEAPHGHAGDAHARATGKLLLALAGPATRDAYLAGLELVARTPNTITSRRALERELDEIRERGYAVDDEEYAIGLGCLAVPFDGRSAFVLAVAGPSDRMRARREEYLASLRGVAGAADDA